MRRRPMEDYLGRKLMPCGTCSGRGFLPVLDDDGDPVVPADDATCEICAGEGKLLDRTPNDGPDRDSGEEYERRRQ